MPVDTTFPLADIAALQASTWTLAAVPQAVVLKANHATGDGGGLFRLDLSDTTSSDDGGTTIRAGQSGGPDFRFKRIVLEGVAHLSWWGTGFGNSSTSTATSAFNTAKAWCSGNDVRKLMLPVGDVYFLTQPNDITSLIDIEGWGQTSSGTSVVRKYTGTSGVGLFSFVGGSNGSRIGGMWIGAHGASSGGAAISIVSPVNPSTPIAQIRLHDMYITNQSGTDKWTNILYFDGTPNEGTGAGGAKGVREIFLDNVSIFGCNGYSAIFLGCVGLKWFGGGSYEAGGDYLASGAMFISGTANVPSEGVQITITDVGNSGNAGLYLDYCHSAELRIEGIAGSIIALEHTTNTWIYGSAQESKQLYWAPNCRLFEKTGAPGFFVHKGNSNQNGIANATLTKLTWPVERFDIGALFASDMWVLDRPGLVSLEAQVWCASGVTIDTRVDLFVTRNGNNVAVGSDMTSAGGVGASAVACVDNAARGDYYEIYLLATTASSIAVDGTLYTHFSGHYVP